MNPFPYTFLGVKLKPKGNPISAQILKASGDCITELAEGANLVESKQTWDLAGDGKNDLIAMLKCCEAELATMKRSNLVAAPFYFERAAILLRKVEQYAGEIEICESYINAIENHYSNSIRDDEADVRNGPRYLAIQLRLAKARALQRKAQSNT